MRTTILCLMVVAACAVEQPPTEATTAQAMLACDDFGCDDAAVALSGAMISQLFGPSHSATDCDVGDRGDGTRVALCAHWHPDGSGEYCEVRYQTGGGVLQRGCTSWLPDNDRPSPA